MGLINQLHGRPDSDVPAPSWESISLRASTAEAAGFDSFVFEDALLYRSEEATDGVWESVSIAAAVAAITTHISLGQSVVNAPYRSPALLAKIADTLDEISGGRFVLGIGAGNTPDSDYAAFGFPADKRYSRFAEAIQIIHGLLKNGAIDFDGEFYSAKDCELVLRGPSQAGPPISIAASGPKMIQLVAEYADVWNWWGWDETIAQLKERLAPIIYTLEQACEALGRDPGSLGRSFDMYTVIPDGLRVSVSDISGLGMKHPVTGSTQEITEHLLSIGELGFDEVRCDVYPKTPAAIEAMRPIVEAVHLG